MADRSTGSGFTLFAVPLLASILIRLVRWTMRLRHLHREPLEALVESGRPYVHAFWHGHLFLMPYSYRGRGISILVSAHKDGELIARTMGWFGHECLRGSTTRGGASALRAAVRALRSGVDVGFTPDGPRGPRHKVQMGVIQAARMGRAPIVPVVFAASRRRVLGSWDGFIVPFPFSRGIFLYGEPMTVASEAGPEEMESARVDLERRLRDLTDEAEVLARGPGAARTGTEARRA